MSRRKVQATRTHSASLRAESMAVGGGRGSGLAATKATAGIFVAGKVEEDRVEGELPLRSGHDIPVRDRRKGKTARLVGRMLQTQENNQHHEQKKTRVQHTTGFISSADRQHRERQPSTQREGLAEKEATGSTEAGLIGPRRGGNGLLLLV